MTNAKQFDREKSRRMITVLKEASEIMEIKLVDHIIVGCGSGRSFSFLAHDLMDGDIVKKCERFKSNKEWER